MLPVSWPLLLVAALLGLIVGSFLNVLIHRLPRMLEAAWQADHVAWLSQQQDMPATPVPAAPRYDLWLPASHCPACDTPLHWTENIPLLGYLRLRGRCAHCQASISPRYPLVELAGALLAVFCIWRYGMDWPALAWFGFGATLLCLALIDQDTGYLPDSLTHPLLWAGLLAAVTDLSSVSPGDALWGAAAGYASLRLVHEAFLRLTGKEGMGHGDFKLLAAIGAWLGWQAMLPVVLLASLTGAIAGTLLKLSSRLPDNGQMPFGPYLAMAAAICWLLGPRWLLQLFPV